MPTFQELKSAFETNYATYMVMGDTAAKSTYTTAKQGMETMLANMQADVTSDSVYITQFLEQYQREHGEIDGLGQKINTIKTEGPELQDKMYQSEIMNPKRTAPIDNKERAIKAGAILVIMLGIGYISTQ
jgi:hypothetical protein